MCHHQHRRWQKFVSHVAYAHATYTATSFSQVLIAAPTCNSAQGFTPWPAKERLNSLPLLNPRMSKSISLPGWYPNYLNDPYIFLQVGAERPRPCAGEEQMFCRWLCVWCGGDELSCAMPLICVGTMGVQPVLGKGFGVSSPNSPESICRSQDCSLWDGVPSLQQGWDWESQKLVAIQPWAEGVSQVSTSYSVLSSWVKLFTGV